MAPGSILGGRTRPLRMTQRNLCRFRVTRVIDLVASASTRSAENATTQRPRGIKERWAAEKELHGNKSGRHKEGATRGSPRWDERPPAARTKLRTSRIRRHNTWLAILIGGRAQL